MVVKITKEDGLFFADNKELGLWGFGDTPEEATQELELHIKHFIEYWRESPESECWPSALKVKKIFAEYENSMTTIKFHGDERTQDPTV